MTLNDLLCLNANETGIISIYNLFEQRPNQEQLAIANKLTLQQTTRFDSVSSSIKKLNLHFLISL